MSATRPPAYDDRFTTPIEASRRGAHRARPKPVASGLPVIAGIAVVLLVVGGVYTVVSGNKSGPSSNLAAASALDNDPDSTATAKASAAATAKATASAQSPAAVASSTDDDSSDETTPANSGSAATGAVNHGVNLVVLNSVPVQGLAKRAQTSLESNGWTVKRTGNSTNRGLATTKVYYGRSADKGTATSLKNDLGFGTLVFDSSVATNGIVVVLGSDAENL
jgi:hypothetical protein